MKKVLDIVFDILEPIFSVRSDNTAPEIQDLLSVRKRHAREGRDVHVTGQA